MFCSGGGICRRIKRKKQTQKTDKNSVKTERNKTAQVSANKMLRQKHKLKSLPPKKILQNTSKVEPAKNRQFFFRK